MPTVKAKLAHAENLAEYLVEVIKANADAPGHDLVHVFEHAIRKVVRDSGSENNALIILAEKEYDQSLNYPFFSWLPKDQRIVT